MTQRTIEQENEGIKDAGNKVCIEPSLPIRLLKVGERRAEQLKKFPDQVPMPQPGAPTTARPRTQLSLPATPHDELRCALNNVLGWNAVSDADLQRTETVVASSEQQSETHGFTRYSIVIQINSPCFYSISL
eukprot:COSAG02_NODE_204_length_29210_cov_36.596579_7_plen_132_part_00